MTQKYKALEEKLAEELNQGWQKLDLREVAKNIKRECTGEDYWWYGYGEHYTPDTLMKEICDELVGDPSKTGSHVDGSVCGVVDRKRDIELLYLRVNEYDRLPDGSSHRKKRDPDEATLIYDVIEDKFLVEPILEAAARKEAEYETEHSRFERVARYLNRNLREFKDWDDEKNRFAIRSMLYGVLGDVGGEDVRTADSGDHMYIDRNNHTHTLLYDAGRNEFMVGNAGTFVPQTKKHESYGDEMTGIDILHQAAKEGLAVYIGEEEYYVHTMNKFFANLYKMTDLDDLPKGVDLLTDPLEDPALSGKLPYIRVNWEEEKKDPVSLTKNLRISPYHVTDYFLDIEEFRKAVIGNTRNSDLIRKMGLEPPEQDALVIPVLQTDGSPLGTKQVVSTIDLPALVERLNDENKDRNAWGKSNPGKTVQGWLEEIANDIECESFAPLGESPKGTKLWQINLKGRDESLFYDYIDHKFMSGKPQDVIRQKEQEHVGYLERLEPLAEYFNEKLAKFKDSDAPNMHRYVTDLLAEANKEIRGDGIFSAIDSEQGVFISYVDKCGNPSIPTILYDGNNKTFVAGTRKELEERQTRECEEAQKKDQNAKTQVPAVFYGSRQENKGAFWESHKLNVECARTLERSLGEHFHDNHLDMKSVFNDIKEYGVERISIVLANTLAIREWDGRFSSENREWGKRVILPESAQEYRYDMAVTSHSTLVDAVIKKTRELEREKHEKGIEIGQRVTFQPHNGNAKLTGIVKEINESEVVLQCGRVTVPALREKGTFAEAPEPEKTTTKEFAKEQAQKHVEEHGNVFTAKGEDATYKGAIVELTPTYAIQKVGEDAILHRLKDLESCKDMIREGAEVSIAKGAKGVVTAEPWSKEQEEHSQKQNQARESVAR